MAAARRGRLLPLLLRLLHFSSRSRPDGRSSCRLRFSPAADPAPARPCPACRRPWRAWITSPPTFSWPSPLEPWCIAGDPAPRARAPQPAWMCAPRAVRPRRRGPLGHRHRQPPFRGREAPLLRPTCWPPASWLICEAGPESPPQPAPRGAPLRSPPRPLRRRLRAAPPAPPRATAAPSLAAPKPITSLRTSSHTCGRTQVNPTFLALVGFRRSLGALSGSPLPPPRWEPRNCVARGGRGGGRARPSATPPTGKAGTWWVGRTQGAWRPRGRAARGGRPWWLFGIHPGTATSRSRVPQLLTPSIPLRVLVLFLSAHGLLRSVVRTSGSVVHPRSPPPPASVSLSVKRVGGSWSLPPGYLRGFPLEGGEVPGAGPGGGGGEGWFPFHSVYLWRREAAVWT